jgi:hypothetical protein
MNGWAKPFVAAVAIAQPVQIPGLPAPPPGTHYEVQVNQIGVERGTLTTNDAKITCGRLNAFFKKMAKESNGKIKPLPRRGHPAVGPKISN